MAGSFCCNTTPLTLRSPCHFFTSILSIIMKVSEETTCIATPGFAGFVPNLRYEYGRTYGNATRHILQIDPSLKQGKIQQDLTKIKSVSSTADSNNLNGGQEYTTANNVVGDAHTNDGYVWKLKNKYHTGDDRFSFPPVPGYTGKRRRRRLKQKESWMRCIQAVKSYFSKIKVSFPVHWNTLDSHT